MRQLQDHSRTTQGQLKDKSKTTRGQPKNNSWITKKQSKRSEKKKLTNLPQANLYDSVISYQARSQLKLKSAIARMTQSSVS